LVPAVPPERADVLAEVRRTGVCVTPLSVLGIPCADEMTAAARGLLDALPWATDSEDSSRPPLADVLESSALWNWGLQHEVLDMVEAYLELPARYHGADVRIERATARSVGVRQWHRDIEDHRMFKIIVWLEDVDPDGGPFEYVPREETARIGAALRYVTGFVSDEDLERQVPRSQWRNAAGPAGTAVLADTRSVFHRAMPPQSRDRYSVTFSFTSSNQVATRPVAPITSAQRERVRRDLDARQLACLARSYAR
jgi:hypothetical protein